MSVGAESEALLSAATGGTMLAFLIFNFAPARIFMGDCGSLFVGLIGYVLATSVMSTPTENIPEHLLLVSKEVLVMGILAFPLVDTLRVFILRAARGISPFHPDRNHLHHILIDLGYRHHQVAIFLGISNYISIIGIGYLSGILNYKMMLVVAIILFTLFLVIVETMKKRVISNLKKK